MIYTDILVVGGGLSGISAARSLQKSGYRFMLLERCPALGGLTRTIEIGDFSFDYTGHFLHLHRYESPSAIPFAGLLDDDWIAVKRHSSCFLADKMISAPIQYHLGELPPDILEKCVRSYDERPFTNCANATTFREYLVSNFGHVLSDLFLIPQNEKTLAISLDRLSLKAIKRFFPVADEFAIRQGIKGKPIVNTGYNTTFWYPRTGGIESLVRGISRGLDNFQVNQDVCVVDLDQRKVITKSGLEIKWNVLLSSIPLPSLCSMTGNPELILGANQLTHSTTICVNIGLNGGIAPPLRDKHWVYVPDRNIPFYRVGVYSNISEGTCSSGRTALYAEVGMPVAQLRHVDFIALQTNVISALEELGWIEREKIESVTLNPLHCAYVHHTPEAEPLVGKLIMRLNHAGIFPFGRYGSWDYTSMEDSIHDGLSVAERVSA